MTGSVPATTPLELFGLWMNRAKIAKAKARTIAAGIQLANNPSLDNG